MLVCAPCVMLFPQVVHAAEVLASGAIGTPELGTRLGLRRRAALGGLRLRSLAVLLGRRRPAGRHGGLSTARDRRPDRAGARVAALELAHARRIQVDDGPHGGPACARRGGRQLAAGAGAGGGLPASVEANFCTARDRGAGARDARRRGHARAQPARRLASRCGVFSRRASGTRRTSRTSARRGPITCSASSTWWSASPAARAPRSRRRARDPRAGGDRGGARPRGRASGTRSTIASTRRDVPA